MQKSVINLRALRGFHLSFALRCLAFVPLLFIVTMQNLYSQCFACIDGGYEIGIPNDPNSVTLLSETDLFSDYPNGLTGNGFDTGCVVVHGKLVVDETYFFDNCTLVMGEGAEIEVQTNVNFGEKLSIRNNTWLYGCTTMWKGVTLSGTNSALDMENSVIKDAQYAVRAENDHTYLRLEGNTFDANYVSVYASPSSSFGGKIISKLSGGNGYIQGNLFVFNSSFLSPFTGQFPSPGVGPYAAFEINDAVNFNVGLPGSGAIVNIVTDIQHGAINRGGKGSANQYTGLQISHPANLYSNSIGVLIEDTQVQVNVEHNNMDRVTNGIVSTRSKAKVFKRNNIHSVKEGIRVYNAQKGNLTIEKNPITSDERQGILILNCNIGNNTSYDIKENNITTLGNSQGIAIYDTQGSLNIVKGNTVNCDFDPSPSGVSPQNHGIQLVRVLGPTTIKETTVTAYNLDAGAGIGVWASENTHIVENVVNGAFDAGIYMENSPKTLLCCNSVPAPLLGGVRIRAGCNDSKIRNTEFSSGSGIGLFLMGEVGPQFLPGNDWTGIPNTFLDAYAILTDPTLSVFYTDINLVPNGHSKIEVPQPIYTPGDWFKLNNTDPSCSSQAGYCGEDPYELVEDPGEFTTLTPLDLSALDTLANPNDVAEQVNQWERQLYLYQKLLANPSLINWNTEVAGFYNNAQNGLIGQFHDIREGISGLSFPPEPYASDLESISADIDTLYNDLEEVEEQLLTATPQEEVFLLAEKEDILDQIAVFISDHEDTEAQIAAWRSSEITALITANNTIQSISVFQQHEKDMNEIYLGTVAQGIHTFSSTQQALVDGIADLCPSTDGTGVLYARAVRQYYDLGWPWALDECMPLEDRSSNKDGQTENTETGTVQIYPNPTSTSFTVQLDQPMEEDGNVNIIGMDGRHLSEHTISAKALSTEISSIRLSPGIYIIEVRTADGHLLTNSRLTILD